MQPDVRFAYQVNKVIDAVDLSCREHRWVQVSEFDTEVDRARAQQTAKEFHANRVSHRWLGASVV